MAYWGPFAYYPNYVIEPTEEQVKASKQEEKLNTQKRGEFKFTDQVKKPKIVPQPTRIDKGWHLQSGTELDNQIPHPQVVFGDLIRDLLGFVGVDGDEVYGITSNIKNFQFIILKNFSKDPKKKSVELRQGVDRYTRGANYVLRVWPSQGKQLER